MRFGLLKDPKGLHEDFDPIEKVGGLMVSDNYLMLPSPNVPSTTE